MLLSLLHKVHYYSARLIIFKIANPISKIEQPSENEKNIITEKRHWHFYINKNRADELAVYYKDDYDEEEMYNIYRAELLGVKVILKDGIQIVTDATSKYYNIVNSRRIVLNVPNHYENNIYVFGNCIAFGALSEDKDAFPNLIQEKINKNYPEKFRVNNCANWGNFEASVRQILSPAYSFDEGDLIILFSHDVNFNLLNRLKQQHFKDDDFVYCQDIDDIFQRPHDYGEILLDHLHLSYKGQRFLADKLFGVIENEYIKKILSQNIVMNSELGAYLKELSDIYIYISNTAKRSAQLL